MFGFPLELCWQGIWRIPVDEIDRPGSFASHMNRSIVLLLEVLYQLKDHDTLLKVSFMLQRTPDQGKKYLRDGDRQVLAKRAFFLTVKVLEDNLNTLTGVSEQPHKVPGTPSVGEMTTTDVSNKPSSEDNRTALPKKPRLADGVAYTVSRDASQAPLAPPVLQSTDKSKESLPEKVDTSGTDGHKAGSEEPMDLGTGIWRRPAGPTEQQTEAGTSAEPLQKVEVGRTSELSLEDLSISSRQQQQLQASATTKVTLPTSGTDQGTPRRPSRKRKLLEDVESGKTLLLDAYRVWQHGQKVMTYDLGRVEKIMSETYMLIKQVDEDVALDQAVKFCQIQLATSAQRQTSVDAPTTPKYSKEHREYFFPASLPTPVLLSQVACHPPSSQDAHAKVAYEPLNKLSRPPAPAFYEQSPAPQQRRGAAATALTPHTGEQEEPLEGVSYRQQESHLCQQMKLASVSQGGQESAAAGWFQEEPASCSTAQPGPDQQQQFTSNEHSKLPDPNRIRSRIPPSMPKLFIPSTVKFPPEITVTPPTPTLLSPKGSISEETKQKLKNVILSSQSAATVKKDTLSQPVLEVQETSSQESSLESESEEEEEEEEYMDT